MIGFCAPISPTFLRDRLRDKGKGNLRDEKTQGIVIIALAMT